MPAQQGAAAHNVVGPPRCSGTSRKGMSARRTSNLPKTDETGLSPLSKTELVGLRADFS